MTILNIQITLNLLFFLTNLLRTTQYILICWLLSSLFSLGFEQSLRACCGHGGKYNYNQHVGCGGKVTVKGKQILVGKACKDPSLAINWDGVHYTEAANKWVFDRIVDGSYSDPPIPLKMACHKIWLHQCWFSLWFTKLNHTSIIRAVYELQMTFFAMCSYILFMVSLDL